MRPRLRLQTSLLLLVLATAVPLVGFAVLASTLFVQHQQETFIGAVKDRNRAFMSAVDAELKGTIAALYALAASPNLARDDLASFHQDANAVLASQPAWFNVILLGVEGAQLVNAYVPWGTPLPQKPIAPESMATIVRDPRPIVDGVVKGGPFIDRVGIPVRVPVMRNDRMRYVLIAILKPEAFQPLLERQQIPAGWVSGLVDAQGRFIARVPPKPAGSFASKTYLDAVGRSDEGWYRGLTVENLDTYTAHLTSPLSRWSIGFAIPADEVSGGLKRAAALMIAGVLVSLAAAIGIALWLGRHISGPIGTLSRDAPFFGSTAPAPAVQTPIVEIAALASAFGEASERIQQRDLALRRSEERFRLSHETALQGFILFKPVRDARGAVIDLRFEYVNPAGADYTHRSAEELVGQSLRAAFPEAEGTGLPALLRNVAETGEPLDTQLHYRADGIDAWLRYLAVRIEDGVGVSCIDVTATKLLEAELRERAEALRQADRSKSEFLALLSHELRNPLAPLTNGLALLAVIPDPERAQHVRAMMERQLRQLSRLIDDLLDLSRIDRGKLELQMRTVSAESFVKAAIEIARPNIEARRHQLIVAAAATVPLVAADEVRMAQVISNLLNNAAKFTPPEGRIEVGWQEEPEQVRIWVRDNGIGFAPENAERIFEMFVQLDTTRAQAATGLGLGLTLARTIVERHGGRIWAESAGLGQGTKIAIALPKAAECAPVLPLRASAAVASAARRILVVDDNADAATSLARYLEWAGHDVRAAFDGLQALGIADQFQPHVILLDLDLPGMDGVEVGRRLRKLPWGSETRLIALTGMGQPSDLERTREAGFDLHLTKPVAPEELLRIVGVERTAADALQEKKAGNRDDGSGSAARIVPE